MARVGVGSDYVQLAVHTLALVPLPGAEDLSELGYRAWVERALPRSAFEPIVRDAALVRSVHAGRPEARCIQWLPELFDSIEQLSAEASFDAAALTDAARPDLLSRLQRSEPALLELVRGAMLLAAPAYRSAWPSAECERGIEAAAVALTEAEAVLPALAASRVELVWALGRRGRAYPDRLLVGVPGDWRGTTADEVAVIAMHELLVRGGRGGWAQTEWRALRELTRCMAVAPSSLRQAHEQWLAALSLTSLCAEAVAGGLVSEELAARILNEPASRVALFGG